MMKFSLLVLLFGGLSYATLTGASRSEPHPWARDRRYMPLRRHSGRHLDNIDETGANELLAERNAGMPLERHRRTGRDINVIDPGANELLAAQNAGMPLERHRRTGRVTIDQTGANELAAQRMPQRHRRTGRVTIDRGAAYERDLERLRRQYDDGSIDEVDVAKPTHRH